MDLLQVEVSSKGGTLVSTTGHACTAKCAAAILRRSAEQTGDRVVIAFGLVRRGRRTEDDARTFEALDHQQAAEDWAQR